MSQLQTRYPMTRQEVSQLFRKPLNQQNSLEAYDVKKSLKFILKRLTEMKKFGYLFSFEQSSTPLEAGYGRKSMCRKVSAVFNCNDCEHTFTSLLATYQIVFMFDSVWKFKDNDPEGQHFVCSGEGLTLQFTPKVYKMDCQKCDSSCEGKVYSSHADAVALSFCVLLAQIVDNIPPKPYYDDRHKQNQNVHFHRHDLCQACRKGVCFNRPKGQDRIKERQNSYDDDFKNQKTVSKQKVAQRQSGIARYDRSSMGKEYLRGDEYEKKVQEIKKRQKARVIQTPKTGVIKPRITPQQRPTQVKPRITSPPKRVVNQRIASPPERVINQRIASPPKRLVNQRITSPPKQVVKPMATTTVVAQSRSITSREYQDYSSNYGQRSNQGGGLRYKKQRQGVTPYQTWQQPPPQQTRPQANYYTGYSYNSREKNDEPQTQNQFRKAYLKLFCCKRKRLWKFFGYLLFAAVILTTFFGFVYLCS